MGHPVQVLMAAYNLRPMRSK